MSSLAAHPGPGRPRSAEADEAIAHATLDLLAQLGYDELTIEAVAEAAGVAKSTVYRRYPSKVDLVVGALDSDHATSGGEESLPDTGSLEEDAVTMLTQLRDRFASETKSRTVAAIAFAASRDPRLAAAHQSFIARRRARGRSLLDRAVERDLLPRDTDTDLLADLLHSPIYYRSFVSRDELDETTIRSVVALVLSGATSS